MWAFLLDGVCESCQNSLNLADGYDSGYNHYWKR